MLRLLLEGIPNRPLNVLCIGAHSDDIEIGCGGTLLRLVEEQPESRVHWVVLSATEEREAEARRSVSDFLSGIADVSIDVEHFRESYFPYLGSDIKNYFGDLGRRVDPDIIFSHHRHDEHQDHRLVAELTWNTFRRHLIAEYEIPKYEGDLGHPNVFVTLSRLIVDRKIELLSTHFSSQLDKYWFRPETFAGLMALRGIEAGREYAEAFHVRKLVI